MGKTRLSLSVEKDLTKKVKHIAIEEDMSVSQMVEDYFKAITKNKNIIRAVQDINK